MATLRWNLDHWRWVKGFLFLNYTTKFGRDFVLNMTLGTNAGGGQMAQLPSGELQVLMIICV